MRLSPKIVTLVLVMALLVFPVACDRDNDDDDSGDMADDDSFDVDDDDDSGPEGVDTGMLYDECLKYLDNWVPPVKSDDPLEREIASAVESFNEKLARAINIENAGYAQKLARLRKAVRENAPGLTARLAQIRNGQGLKGPVQPSDAHIEAIGTALLFVETLEDALENAYCPSVSVPAGDSGGKGGFIMHLNDAVLDCYWTYYHWIEIAAGYYDDTGYEFVYADAGRESFIEEEVGEAGVEMVMDWWRVLKEHWNDEELTPEQRLMCTKYAMWDDPHWGNQEWVEPYWQQVPAFKDEDCALFTGNMMGALAFEYGLTRLPRTLSRMQAILRAFRLFDRFTLDTDHPLDQEGYDGRIQRGTMTKNLYTEDERNLYTIESWDPFEGSHNNSWPDRLTGRERKNVSRDQYYGLFLGYYAAFKTFSSLTDRTPEEEEFFCDVILHMDMILKYLFSNRIRPEHGLLYNLYALLEGSCANPPNLTFMNLWSYPGFEEMTGRDYSARFGWGHDLIHALLVLGRVVGGVELSQQLFDPAQSSLTALNQYMITLYMGDVTAYEWQFIYPPEVLVEHPDRHKLWRRVIALYYSKFGGFGNELYRDVIERMLLAENNPAPEIGGLAWHSEGDYIRVEPQYKLEELMLPLAVVASGALNRNAVARDLLDHYQDMLSAGAITFEGTDLPY